MRNMPDMGSLNTSRYLTLNFLCLMVLAIAIAARIALLLTSQSMPDGDEAVEGIMALHVLEYGIHPVYPYGVHYGAGAGVEVHFAALLFRLFGSSEFLLKFVALSIWLLSCLLLYAVVKKKVDQRTACISVMLYAMCPALWLFSLKVSGGHQVAVTVGLLALWLLEDARLRYAGLALLPLAAYLHPIVAPYCGSLLLYGLYLERKSWHRFGLSLVGFALACLVVWLVLRPDAGGVHHPENQDFQLLDSVYVFMKMVPLLFIPNVNATYYPGIIESLITFLWSVATIASLLHAVRRRTYHWIFLMLGCSGTIFIVRPELLVQRHLLMLYPFICVLLAISLNTINWRIIGLSILLSSGTLICALEMQSPYIYGPGSQSYGVNREEFRTMMNVLRDHKIRYVYCLDPMLQWNIIFSSREKIIARWRQPTDRVPHYLREVDLARMNGERIALVYSEPVSGEKRHALKVLLQPDDALITELFAPAL